MDDTAFRPKVLITKIGLDGHDRGSRIVAAHLRDAGMEVVYTPPWQEIKAVVKLATEEDVDVIGISSLATDHLIVPKLMLLGALNWSQTWYRPGKDSPQVLARRFVRLLRDPLET